MRLSSAYIAEQLGREYVLASQRGIGGDDGFLRPFFVTDFGVCASGHVYVLNCAAALPGGADRLEGLFLYCGEAAPTSFREPYLHIKAGKAGNTEERRDAQAAHGQDALLAEKVLNSLQNIFEACEEWERRLQNEILQRDDIAGLLQAARELLDNPVFVMGLDFTLLGETGLAELPEQYRLFGENGIDIDHMNALLQNDAYQRMEESSKTVLFPASISGLRSLNRNLFPRGKRTCRVVFMEWNRPFTEGDCCLIETLAQILEILLSRSSLLAGEDSLKKILTRILTDRTADYLEMSRLLSAQGWNSQHQYLCLTLQLTYLNQKNLSTNAICHYIKNKFPHSCSFPFQGEIVTFFDLSLLEKSAEEVGSALTYFIRDSYLKAGYSRTVKGHIYFRRLYMQSRTALDVGSRKRPYIWIHHFDQVALPYIMEQITRRLPAAMICHTGLLRLSEADEQGHSEYMKTLLVYLQENLNATRAAEALFIHRSTFLYRLARIKEILQSELDDPEEIFYLNLSFRLLEQEKEHQS